MLKVDSRGNSHLQLKGTIVPTDKELAEGYMLRAVDVLGVPHHCEFIRVEVVNDLQQAWVSDTSDPDNVSRFDDMQSSSPEEAYYVMFFEDSEDDMRESCESIWNDADKGLDKAVRDIVSPGWTSVDA